MDAIILSAGIGSRAKLNYPKQFMRLGGRPLLIHILDIFLSLKEIENIFITVPCDLLEEFSDLLEKYFFNNNKINIVLGGATRQESVYLALQYIKSDRVIIHESVRPFITKSHILDLMSHEDVSIVPCVPIIPTVYSKKGSYIDRETIVNIQLPQIFNTEILQQAHYKARGKTYTDDSSLLFGEFLIRPALVKGLEENIKITTPLDVKIAEVIYEEFSNNHRWE
jgi:2-C-methyl-D-erythritol 4-phosphate cytidylyltransferase